MQMQCIFSLNSIENLNDFRGEKGNKSQKSSILSIKNVLSIKKSMPKGVIVTLIPWQQPTAV